MSGVAAVRYSFNVRREGACKVLREGPATAAVQAGRVPRVARLLALAHRFQGMLDRGDVESMAEIARLREQADLIQQLIERVEYDGQGGGVTIAFRGTAPGADGERSAA